MARKVKFPLKLADGTEARTLEELKEHFDVKSVVGYFNDGRLLTWLRARRYEYEEKFVEQLAKDDKDVAKKLCEIFGVESHEDVDPEEIARRQERLNRLKQYTFDKEILERVDQVAFDQEDFSDLLDENATLIYLCNNSFVIPLRETHKTYVGVGRAIAVIRSNKIVDFDALNIEFKNVTFDDKYAAILKTRDLLAEKQRVAENAMRPKQLFEEGVAAGDRNDFETALKKLKESANQGYAPAFSFIATLYNFGEGVDKDLAEARRWYKRGMEKEDGDSFGGYAMTLIHEGEPTDADKREAFKCLKRAIELNAAGADTWWDELGDMYRYGAGTTENIEEAIRCYEKGVELGNSFSANSLGVIYGKGEHVEKNSGKAFELIKLAVDLNGDNIQAVANLGYHYRYGIGTAIDSAKAFQLYLKAAKAGHVDAMCIVGFMYFKGEGVQKNEKESFAWTKKAAEAGDLQGMKNHAYDYLNGFGTPKNAYKAIEWYSKAADEGDTDSLVSIGYIYRDGDGIPKDFQKAAAYFKAAAEAGNADAMNGFGNLYDYGQGVAEDKKLAFRWYLRAAEAGSLIGMANVGTCYFWGRGISKDMVKASSWLRQSAEGGNYVGMLYYGNYFFELNNSSAIDWYKKAFEKGNSGEAAYKLHKIYKEGKCGVSRDSWQADYWERKYKELGYKPDDGCFITTAVCASFGKGDDCFELTTFRNFRDGWLAAQPDGKNLIAEYYSTAPAIVDRINRLSDAAQIYKNIWQKYLAPCLAFIEQGDNQSCKKLYVEMVTSLKKKFLDD